MIFDLTEALEVTSNTSVEEVELEALAIDLPDADGEGEALQRKQVKSCRWVVAKTKQEAHLVESQLEAPDEIEEGSL